MGYFGGYAVVPLPSLENVGAQLVRALQDFVREVERFIQYVFDELRRRVES